MSCHLEILIGVPKWATFWLSTMWFDKYSPWDSVSLSINQRSIDLSPIKDSIHLTTTRGSIISCEDSIIYNMIKWTNSNEVNTTNHTWFTNFNRHTTGWIKKFPVGYTFLFFSILSNKIFQSYSVLVIISLLKDISQHCFYFILEH